MDAAWKIPSEDEDDDEYEDEKLAHASGRFSH
jgi:hypothetical protein